MRKAAKMAISTINTVSMSIKKHSVINECVYANFGLIKMVNRLIRTFYGREYGFAPPRVLVLSGPAVLVAAQLVCHILLDGVLGQIDDARHDACDVGDLRTSTYKQTLT